MPYEDLSISAELGRGAFGRVYRAEWNGTEVAMKELIPGPGSSREELLDVLIPEVRERVVAHVFVFSKKSLTVQETTTN